MSGAYGIQTKVEARLSLTHIILRHLLPVSVPQFNQSTDRKSQDKTVKSFIFDQFRHDLQDNLTSCHFRSLSVCVP